MSTKKYIIPILFLASATLMGYGQCSTVSIQVASSDTMLIKLYHAGFFNIPFGFDNVCEWEVTSFSGGIIFKDTTSGGFNEQSSVIFNHSVPITDSMKATIIITNNAEGIVCTINDTLYWKETEVVPGAFIGNWEVLSANVGIEEDLTSSIEIINAKKEIKVFPSPVYEYFWIDGNQEDYSFSLLNLKGQTLRTFHNIQNKQKVSIFDFPTGMYFIQFQDENNRILDIKKIIKK